MNSDGVGQRVPLLRARCTVAVPISELVYSNRHETVYAAGSVSGLLFGLELPFDSVSATGRAKIETVLRVETSPLGITGLVELERHSLRKNLLLLGNVSGDIKVFDEYRGEVVATVLAHSTGLRSLVHSDHHKLLFTIGQFNARLKSSAHVLGWNTDDTTCGIRPEGPPCATIKVHEGTQPVACRVFHDGALLVTSDLAGLFCVYRLPDVVLAETFSSRRPEMYTSPAIAPVTVCLTLEGHSVIVSAGTAIEYFYSEPDLVTEPLVAACYAPSTHLVVTLSHRGRACVWDLESNGALVSQTVGPAYSTCASWDGTGEQIIIGDEKGSVRVLDARTGELLRQLEPHGSRAGPDGFLFSEEPAAVSGVMFAGGTSQVSISTSANGIVIDDFTDMDGAVVAGVRRPVAMRAISFPAEFAIVSAAASLKW